MGIHSGTSTDLETDVTAIKAKTDNLPIDPADASDIAASFAITDGKIDTVDTVVDAIKAITDNLPDGGALTTLITHLTDIKGAGWTNENLKVIDSLIDAIKAKTDLIGASVAPANEYNTEMARITANVATEAKQDIIDTNLDRSLETKIIFSDILASLVFSDVAADKDFPSIVFPTGFLPSGAIVDSIFIGVTWRRQVNTDGAENGVNGASKKIRIMKSGAVWGTNDIVAIDIPDNFILTDASATEGGTDILGDNDVKSEVDDVDNETYLIRTEETQRNDAMVVDAEYLTLYDIQSFAIVSFKLSS